MKSSLCGYSVANGGSDHILGKMYEKFPNFEKRAVLRFVLYKCFLVFNIETILIVLFDSVQRPMCRQFVMLKVLINVEGGGKGVPATRMPHLLVKQSPEHWQRNEQKQHTESHLYISNKFCLKSQNKWNFYYLNTLT